MKLREGEQILKIYHHHPTPFILNILKVIAGSFPFLLILFLFKGVFSTKGYVIANMVLIVVFILIIIYVSLIYWLDKLYITDQRIIFVNWKYLTVVKESQLEIEEIQDVQTYEKGFLSYFWFFDYGRLVLATASSYIALIFEDAPNPEELRFYIQHIKKQ